MLLQSLLFDGSLEIPQRKVIKIYSDYDSTRALEELSIESVGLDLLSGKVEKQSVGPNYKGLCPFHKERSSSFYLKPEPNIARCYGCNYIGSPLLFLEDFFLNKEQELEYLRKKINLNPESKNQMMVYEKILRDEKSKLR